MIRRCLLRLQSGKPFADQVEIDLLFNLPVGQIVQKLWGDVAHHSELVEEQNHYLQQYQRVPRRPAVMGTVAVTDCLRDETKVYGWRQFAQQMVGGDQAFVDHSEKAALRTVLALHKANHRSRRIMFQVLPMILTHRPLDINPPPAIMYEYISHQSPLIRPPSTTDNRLASAV